MIWQTISWMVWRKTYKYPFNHFSYLILRIILELLINHELGGCSGQKILLWEDLCCFRHGILTPNDLIGSNWSHDQINSNLKLTKSQFLRAKSSASSQHLGWRGTSTNFADQIKVNHINITEILHLILLSKTEILLLLSSWLTYWLELRLIPVFIVLCSVDWPYRTALPN